MSAFLNGQQVQAPVHADMAQSSRTFPKLVANDADELLHGLFMRAADKLTPEDLDALAGCDESVYSTLGQITRVCSGIGCLIASDTEPGMRVGAFQSADDVPALLWAIGGLAEKARALLALALAARLQQQFGVASPAYAQPSALGHLPAGAAPQTEGQGT